MPSPQPTYGIQISCDRLRITGADRVSWFHNFCTADIKGLVAGDTAEAFVLNGKGKILGWVQVVNLPDSLEVILPLGEAAALKEHLERYIIRENVEVQEVDPDLEWEFWFWGPGLLELAREWGWAEWPSRDSREVVLNGQQVRVVPSNLIGAGVLVSVDAQALSQPEVWFSGLAVTEGTVEQLAWHRLSHRCPKWNTDFNQEALPQELMRDDLAISFTKGCYLGQETVARIDALGHVNRCLSVVSFSGAETVSSELPWTVTQGGQTVGQITSVAAHPEIPTQHLALGLLKRGVAKPGQTVQLAGDRMGTVVEPTAISR
jgi:tRNA-modifying protein YgfZ